MQVGGRSSGVVRSYSRGLLSSVMLEGHPR